MGHGTDIWIFQNQRYYCERIKWFVIFIQPWLMYFNNSSDASWFLHVVLKLFLNFWNLTILFVSYLSTKTNCLGLCHFTVTLFACLFVPFFFFQILKFVFLKSCYWYKAMFRKLLSIFTFYRPRIFLGTFKVCSSLMK